MMDLAENVARIAGALAFVVVFGSSGLDAFRAKDRDAGRASGVAARTGALVAYLLAAAPYAIVCALLWRDLPVHPSQPVRAGLLTFGVIVGVGGLRLYVSGRRALGAMYNVSSVLGSELYAHHHLVTGGPYRIVRHPMYVGLAMIGLGGLALYRTWTFVFVIAALAGAVVKARREDTLLAVEFGGEFERYRAQVPGWFPRLRRRPEERPAAIRRAA